jgi:transcriptional regulator with XRE-family HTH domain
MKRFGEELKYSRESRGISLQDISKDTRINQKFIEAIEEGNFGVLPQTYIRAFIRAYAKYIGLNPNETIARYELYVHGKVADDKQKNQKTEKSEKQDKPVQAEPEPIAEPVKEIEQETPIKKIEDYLSQAKPSETETPAENYSEDDLKTHVKYTATKPKVNYAALFLVIGALAIVVIFVILNLPSGKGKEQERVSFDNVLKETEQKYNPETAKPVKDSAVVVLPKSDSLTLAILSETDIWVNVKMDNDRSDRGMLTANTKKYLRAKENFIVSAKSGKKIKIFLDEKFLGNLSQSDSLKSVLITPEGIKSLKITKKPAVQKTDLKMMDLKPLDPKLP